MSEIAQKRAPQVFDADDPIVVEGADAAPAPEPRMAPRFAAGRPDHEVGSGADSEPPATRPVASETSRWPGLLSIFVGAMVGLAGVAASVSFATFVSVALGRSDWVGTVAWALLGIAAVTGGILALREVIGLMRLGRLARLRHDADAAVRSRDARAERSVLRRLKAALAGRKDLSWALARFGAHEGDVRDPGELLALADRELLAPLDTEVRRLVLTSAKRVSLVTAMSPMVFIAVGFVLIENLRLLRAIATVYGGRPGVLGGLRLGRMVLVHLLATGGVALTDDLLGQFIGQDLMRRLSRRLGEGLFNGAMTARVGVAAVEVCRPLPYIEAKPVRVRDVVAELTRRAPAATAPGAAK